MSSLKRMFSETAYSQDASQSSKKFKPTKKRTYNKPTLPPGMLAKAIKKELYKQAETKCVNAYGSEVGISSIATGTGLTLNSQPYPAVGADNHQRVGNKIQPVGFSFNSVYWNSYAYPVFVRRLIIQVYDGEKSNSEILNELFEGTSNNDSYDVGAIDALIRKTNREGFKCLKDDIIEMGINNGGKSIAVRKCYVKLSGSQTYRDAGVTHATNDRIVVIHLAREGDGDESTGSTIEMSYAMQFYYKDI